MHGPFRGPPGELRAARHRRFVLASHDLRLVALALGICAASCAAGLRAVQLWQGQTRYPRSWMWLALLALGVGVWATHFTAMLGFRPDLLVGFAVMPTLGSALIAVFGVGGALLLGARRRTLAGDFVGGLGVGAATGVMHGVGVAGLTGCSVSQPALRGLLALWLTEAGHDVRAHATGRPSGDPAKLADADLVVTDLMMPDCDGLEVIMNVRRLRPAAAIIAMSGGGRTVVRNLLPMARDLGARAVLEKPFMPDDLLDAIDAALG